MPTVTKRELATKITNRLGSKGVELTQHEVSQVVQGLLDEVMDALSRGDNVILRNFASFDVREVKAKVGRNPKNPVEEVHIPAKAVVRFRPGKEMKDKVATTLQLIRERKG